MTGSTISQNSSPAAEAGGFLGGNRRHAGGRQLHILPKHVLVERAGINNNGTATVAKFLDVLWQQLEDDYGGGISNDGKLAVANCTFSGNAAFYGGGISNQNGTVTVTDTTISDNSTYYYGGGIETEGGTATLANTILGGDTGSGSPNDISGSVTANYCLIQSTSGVTISGLGNVLNELAHLGSLGNYGGPTETIPLLPGSPAIDAGSAEPPRRSARTANRSPPTSEGPAIPALSTAPSIWVRWRCRIRPRRWLPR